MIRVDYRKMLSVLLAATGYAVAGSNDQTWSRLPDLPEPLGVAAPFAGVSNGVLLVGGGANFPHGMPWEGGKKVWRDQVWGLTLTSGAAAWKEIGKLPRPLAYGISLNLNEGVFCAGGSDAERHHAECFSLIFDGSLQRKTWPPLPIPLATAGGALLSGNRVVIACGAEKPGELSASNRVFVMNTAASEPSWQELPKLPAAPRILPITAANGDAFYIIGGVALEMGVDGKVSRVYLKDAWRHTAAEGWIRLADAPKTVAAAASPAPVVNGEALVMAGDDGSRFGFQPPEKHPGFPATILAYDMKNDRWREAGNVPASRATLPCIPLPDGRFALASGEIRPGVRSPEIWILNRRLQP